jgi:hypothetical protein
MNVEMLSSRGLVKQILRCAQDDKQKSRGKDKNNSRFFAALRMTTRKARAKTRAAATTNTGILRCAQDDGQKD